MAETDTLAAAAVELVGKLRDEMDGMLAHFSEELLKRMEQAIKPSESNRSVGLPSTKMDAAVAATYLASTMAEQPIVGLVAGCDKEPPSGTDIEFTFQRERDNGCPLAPSPESIEADSQGCFSYSSTEHPIDFTGSRDVVIEGPSQFGLLKHIPEAAHYGGNDELAVSSPKHQPLPVARKLTFSGRRSPVVKRRALTPPHATQRWVPPVEGLRRAAAAKTIDPDADAAEQRPRPSPLDDSDIFSRSTEVSETSSASIEICRSSRSPGPCKRIATAALTNWLGKFTLKQFFKGSFYEITSAIVIILSFFVAAATTERRAWLLDNGGVDDKARWVLAAIETTLCMILVADVTLRTAYLRRRLLQPDERFWGFVDLVLALVALVEVAHWWLRLGTRSENFPFRAVGLSYAIRVARLLPRLAACPSKSLRTLCLLHDLRLLLDTLFKVAVVLAWLTLGFAFLLCIFAIILTDGAVAYCSQSTAVQGAEEVKTFFGNLRLSLYTLCQVGFGGILWCDVAACIDVLGIAYVIAFHVYAVFVCSVVKALTIAAFVQAFSERSRQRAEEVKAVADRTFDEKRHFIDAFNSALRAHLDSTGSGFMQLSELEAIFDSPHSESGQLHAYIKALELNSDHLKTLLNVLDAEQTGEISVDAFVSACLYLGTNARASDVVLLQYEVGVLRGMIDRVVELRGKH